MGNIQVKDDIDGWRPGIPFVRASSGWARAKIAYRKTAPTVWTPFFTVDQTPPAVPTIVSITSNVANKLLITVKAPTSSDIKSVRVKVGRSVSLNNTTDSNYIHAPDGNDENWSDWKMTPGQTRTKTYPTDTSSLTSGVTYYVTAWAEDKSRNFSFAVSSSHKFTPAAAVPRNRMSLYVPSVGSNTWRTIGLNYYNDNYLRTGYTWNQTSRWYYSNQLQAVLSRARSLNSISIQVQRISATNVDKAPITKLRLFAHKLTGAIPLDPQPYNVATDDVVYDFAHGQTKTLPIPKEWWPDIMSGKIKGFGIFSRLGVPNDQYTATYYGYPTTSGRVFLDWNV